MSAVQTRGLYLVRTLWPCLMLVGIGAVVPAMAAGVDVQALPTPPALTPAAVTAVGLCAAGTPDHDAAEQRLRRLGQQIAALKGRSLTGNGTAAQKALLALLSSRCFEVARTEWEAHTGRPGTLKENRGLPSNGAVLLDWWRAGGAPWLSSQLHPLVGERQALVVFPPEPRITIKAQANPGLDHITCPDGGGSACGREADAILKKTMETTREFEPNSFATEMMAKCAESAAGIPEPVGYATWRDCVEAERPRQPILPLGSLDLPRLGWMVFRRPHTVGCTARTATDLVIVGLADGALYRASRCGAQSPRITVGHVSTRAARALALLTLVSPAIRNLRPLATVPLPTGVVPLSAPRPAGRREEVNGAISHARILDLRWSWLLDGEVAAEGFLPTQWGWGEEGQHVEGHLVADAIESGLRPHPSCPAALPDLASAWLNHPLSKTEAPLVTALGQERNGRCLAPPGRR